jgi:hypothetical protein
MSYQNTQQWSSNTSGIKKAASPYPLGFTVPSNYAATATTPGAPILVDPYTVQFKLNPPLVIPENCCMALDKASFAYTQPNIVGAATLEAFPNGNNRVTINVGGAGNVDVVLDDGLYTYLDVQQALNVWVRSHTTAGAAAPPGTPIVAGSTDLFILTGITSTQKIILSLNPAALTGGVFPVGNFVVNFTNPSPVSGNNDSMGTVLGFPVTGGGAVITAPAGGTDVYSAFAPNVSDFANASAYTLYVSLVTGSYQNGSAGQLLYSFPLGGFEPNSVAAYQSTQRYPVPVSSGTYSSVTVWTADQSGNRFPWSYYQAPFTFDAIISKNKDDGSI